MEGMIGDNLGAPYAEGITGRLEMDYAELVGNTRDLLEFAQEQLPSTVESSFDLSAIADVVKKMGDMAARGEAHRVAEKEPYLRSGDAVHAFFSKRIIEPLTMERKKQAAKLDVYKQRQLAEERARRAAAMAEARRIEEEAQRREVEAIARARRARSAATIEQRTEQAEAARIEAQMAEAQAEEAKLATMASSSDLVRERFVGDRSGQVTMRKTNFAVIEKAELLDLEKLRPYLKEEHLLAALKLWARATNYQLQMPGAIIGTRDSTVVR